MSCLPQTRPTVFLRIKTIKATNALQMLYSISTSKLHHTSGQWCIVISFSIKLLCIVFLIAYYVLSLLTLSTKKTFTINSLHKKNHHKHPPALIYAMHLQAQHHRHHTSAKQLGCSRSLKCVAFIQYYTIDSRGGRDWKRNHTRVFAVTAFRVKLWCKNRFWSQPKPAPLVKILHLCRTKQGLSDTHNVNKSKPTV